MKKVILCVSLVGMFTLASNAQNADIVWGTPTTVSGASDVSTLGTVVGTWAPGDDAYNPDALPVNGVTFNAYGSGPFNSVVSSGVDDHYTGFGNAGTPDSNYNTILQAALYNNGEAMTFTWDGMTGGNIYQLEFWVNDGRNSTTAERTETLTGGSLTSTPLDFGTGVNGTGPGQYIIGTFVADSTGTETLTINPFGGADITASAQINLLQLRDISPVPEPSMLAIFAIGICGVLVSCRRKSRLLA